MVAIHTGPLTHLDHLGILATLLEIPLIVTDEAAAKAIEAFYPQMPFQFREQSELTLSWMASNFNTLMGCGKYWTEELKPLFPLFFGKEMRFVLCPHGNSDKGRTPPHPQQDIVLVYGDQMLDHLKRSGALQKIKKTVLIGNFRSLFYRTHRSFYEALINQMTASKFSRTKTILYAPTWADGENPSSFFLACKTVLQQLSSRYNVIVKLHPLLEEQFPSEIHSISSEWAQHQNVLLLTDFPLIYPLLAISDLFLGDFSSIGYDFLTFENKPLFFFHHSPELLLHQCGMGIPEEALDNLSLFIERRYEENLESFAKVRKEIAHYTFGEEREPELIKQELKDALSER